VVPSGPRPRHHAGMADRVGSYDRQAGFPRPPPSREPHPMGAIWTREAGRLGGALKHQELVTEGQVLEEQVATTLQRRHGQTKEQHEPSNHAPEDASGSLGIPVFSGWTKRPSLPICRRPLALLKKVARPLRHRCGDSRQESDAASTVVRGSGNGLRTHCSAPITTLPSLDCVGPEHSAREVLSTSAADPSGPRWSYIPGPGDKTG